MDPRTTGTSGPGQQKWPGTEQGRSQSATGQTVQTPDQTRIGTSGPTAALGAPASSMETAGSTMRSAEQEETGSKAERVKAAASDTAQKAVEGIKGAAQDAADQVRERGETWAVQQKEWAVDEMAHCATAARRAAETLRESSDHNLAAVAEYIADKVERYRDYLRDSDAGQLRRDVEQFARNRPELFYGGLFVAGLAIARFLKASPPRREPQFRSGESERYRSERSYGKGSPGPTAHSSTANLQPTWSES